MTREVTSKRVAKIAGKILGVTENRYATVRVYDRDREVYVEFKWSDIHSLAASALTQTANKVLETIGAGWATVPDLCAMTGWKPHTLRAFLSRTEYAIERRRINGVTSYRFATYPLKEIA